MAIIFCRNCGSKIKMNYTYCNKCGIKVVKVNESVVVCSLCEFAFSESAIVRCYDCGKPYCIDCAGSNWIGVCPDCEEVFEAEEDYWGWR